VITSVGPSLPPRPHRPADSLDDEWKRAGLQGSRWPYALAGIAGLIVAGYLLMKYANGPASITTSAAAPDVAAINPEDEARMAAEAKAAEDARLAALAATQADASEVAEDESLDGGPAEAKAPEVADGGEKVAAKQPDAATDPKVADAKAAEDAKKVADAKAAEDAKKVADAKAAEDAKKVADAKAAEDAKKVADAKAAEDAKKVADAKAAEDAKKVADAKAAEDAKKAADAKGATNDADYAKLVASGQNNYVKSKLAASANDFKKALAINPEGPEALIGMGLALADVQPQKAIGFLEKGLARAPNNARAHATLGTAYQTAERKADAVREYRKYLELEPNGELADEVRSVLDSLK
jgi:hypothetical protein